MKVLIATDGSTYSLAAAKKCCKMLELHGGATIRIISVAENIISSSHYGALSDKYLTIAKQAARSVAENAVEDARHLIREEICKGDVDIETKTIIGYPKEAILDDAANWEADLIVVGSHGRGFLKRMFLGSVSNAIVRHAECSVLVVRADDFDLKEFDNEV